MGYIAPIVLQRGATELGVMAGWTSSADSSAFSLGVATTAGADFTHANVTDD